MFTLGGFYELRRLRTGMARMHCRKTMDTNIIILIQRFAIIIARQMRVRTFTKVICAMSHNICPLIVVVYWKFSWEVVRLMLLRTSRAVVHFLKSNFMT